MAAYFSNSKGVINNKETIGVCNQVTYHKLEQLNYNLHEGEEKLKSQSHPVDYTTLRYDQVLSAGKGRWLP